jgi:CSLREA domain-containing protein
MRLGRSAVLLVLLPWALGLFSSPASAATITVTTTVDEWDENPAECGLREAIQAANTDASFGGCRRGNGADTIQLGPGPYVLDEQNPFDAAMIFRVPDNTNENGDLDIGEDLTLLGPTGDLARIDADDHDRVLHVLTGADVTMRRLDIRDGSAPSTLMGQLPGGGIRVEGSLLLENSQVVQNVAAGSGGGIAGTNITIRRTIISANTSTTIGGGGVSRENAAGSITIVDSIFDINHSESNGGALINHSAGTVTVVRTLFRDNTADSSGGGVYQSPTVAAANLIVTDSYFQTNTADFDANASGHGGGISSGSGAMAEALTVSGTTFEGNKAVNGDGVAVIGETATISNSTLTQNGGVSNGGQGGGLFNASSATSVLRNVTFDGNAVSASGNGAHVYNLGTVNVRNSVFGPDLNGGGCNSPLNEPGPNLEENGGAAPCVAGQTGDLRLDVLEDNGGPQLFDFVGAPKTHALEAGSPAIGEGTGCEATDERGVPRPQGNGCDLGAYEVAMCFGRPADDPVGITGGQTARTGTAGADVLFGLGARERIRGLGGNDRLCGGGGRDRLEGGAGKDRLDGGPQRDTCAGGPGRDRARACERVTGVP